MSKNNKADMYLDMIALHKEVTGSCILCKVRLPNRETLKFIVDCGLFQEEKYNSLFGISAEDLCKKAISTY